MKSSVLVENLDPGAEAGQANPVSPERVWAGPNDQGVFDPADCEQIYAPVLEDLDCTIHVIEQPDGWRSNVEARLPNGGMGGYPATSEPAQATRELAILAACESLIGWLSGAKERGSKKHQKLAGKLQDWALDLEKKHRSPAEPETAATPAAHPESESLPGQDQPTTTDPTTATEIVYTSAIPEGELHLIPITQLFHSPWNPRQYYPEAPMAELVESMRTSGFRQWLPLMVRPIEGGYEIGAGHRRRIAAERAGITEIPCIVRPLSDEQFLDVLNFDNTGREDVHPLHEASGWRQWMEKTGKGVLDIAARIGQSKEYVYQRLKYAALIPEAQAAFLDGRITAGHAILIARREGDQARWLKFALTPGHSGAAPSVRALVEELHRAAYIDLRDDCPFDRADRALLSGAGSCDECPKRAANIPGFEFEEGGAQADLCTDRKCHGQKVDNHLYRIRTDIYASEGHFPLQVSRHWATKIKGAFAQSDWDEAKPADKGGQTAVIVEGVGLGQVIQIRLKKAAPAASPETGLAEPPKSSSAARADQERQRAAQEAKQKAEAERELAVRRQILLAVRAKVGGLSRADIEAFLQDVFRDREDADELCGLHGIKFSQYQAHLALTAALPRLKETELFQLAVESPVIHELDGFQLQRPPTMLLALAKRYRVDAAKIRKEAERATKAAASEESREKPAPEKAKRAAPAKKLSADVRKRIAKGNKERWAKFRKKQRTALKKKAGSR